MIQYSVTMRTVQSWTCELGYGADTMFHRTYFLFLIIPMHMMNREIILGRKKRA